MMLSFTACSSDDDASDNNNSIVGKWKFEQIGTIENGQEVLLNYEHECASSPDYMEFYSSGTVEVIYINMNCHEEIESSDNWVLNGNNLSISTVDGPLAIEILTLTATTLKFKFTEINSNETVVAVFSRM